MRTILIIDQEQDGRDLDIHAERLDLAPGDVLILRGEGEPLDGDDAHQFEISELERQLDRCHELIDSLRAFVGRAAAATRIEEISDALAEYAGVRDVPTVDNPRWIRPSRLSRILRRRPTGQA